MTYNEHKEISLPSAVKRGVEMAKSVKVVCSHKWKKADGGLGCFVCKLCGAYSAYSAIRIPLCPDEQLSEEIVAASHQYALAYNKAVDLVTESLPYAVGTASLECEDWQKKKKIDQYYPTKKNVKKWATTKNELWLELTDIRDTDSRFDGPVSVQRSGMNDGLNAVLASYERYSQAHNSIFHITQYNHEALEHNKKLILEHEKEKEANPNKKIAAPKLRKMKKVKKSDIEAIEADVYEPERLMKKKKKRQRKQIVIPIQEKAKYYAQHNAFKLNGINTWLKPKGYLPEGLEIRNGIVVEKTSHVSKHTQPNQRKYYLHLIVRHLIPEPSGAEDNAIGIDINIAVTIATSDGEYVHLPEELHQIRKEIKRWQRLKSKRKQKSKGWSEAVRTIATLSKLLAAKKKQFITETAQRHCEENSLIGLEKLDHKSMRKSARGTRQKPGKNVSAKKGLNRELAFIAPGIIIAAYKRAAIKTGTRIVLVSPKNSSMECSACGYISKKNRESQAVFLCKNPTCGHSENADINAGQNILARAVDIISAERLAADTSNMSAGGLGESPLQPDEPSLRTQWHGQFSEAGEAESDNIDPIGVATMQGQLEKTK